MTLTAQDVEFIRAMILSAKVTSAGDSTRDINRVQDIGELPPISGEEGTTPDDGLGDIGDLGGFKTGDITSTLQSTRGGNIMSLLGKGASFVGVASTLAIPLMIQPVTEGVIDELQRPGGFLDKRVKIDARNEAFAELDRQTRQNTRIGDRTVRIQQFQGFRNYEGYASTNTSKLIRENADRVLDIGLFDRAKGLN
jgi:hypothetical protein